MSYEPLSSTLDGPDSESTPTKMPGENPVAYIMLPLRLVFFTVMFIIMYPLMLVVGTLRAIYLRLAVGKSSVVLKYGAYPHPKEAVDGALHTSSHQQCEVERTFLLFLSIWTHSNSF